MAQYQHLPIYKSTYELLRLITHATAGFAKAYKYSLGDNRIEHGFDALGYVIRPYSRYLRRDTVRNGRNKLAGLRRSGATLNDVRQAAHSYFGIFGHADTWKLQGRLSAALYRAGYGAAVPAKLNDARFPR